MTAASMGNSGLTNQAQKIYDEINQIASFSDDSLQIKQKQGGVNPQQKAISSVLRLVNEIAIKTGDEKLKGSTKVAVSDLNKSNFLHAKTQLITKIKEELKRIFPQLTESNDKEKSVLAPKSSDGPASTSSSANAEAKSKAAGLTQEATSKSAGQESALSASTEVHSKEAGVSRKAEILYDKLKEVRDYISDLVKNDYRLKEKYIKTASGDRRKIPSTIKSVIVKIKTDEGGDLIRIKPSEWQEKISNAVKELLPEIERSFPADENVLSSINNIRHCYAKGPKGKLRAEEEIKKLVSALSIHFQASEVDVKTKDAQEEGKLAVEEDEDWTGGGLEDTRSTEQVIMGHITGDIKEISNMPASTTYQKGQKKEKLNSLVNYFKESLADIPGDREAALRLAAPIIQFLDANKEQEILKEFAKDLGIS